MPKKVPPLVYPFTYEEWLADPSTKKKLKIIKKICERWRKEDANGKQLTLDLKI
jgi:hypothetical protein